MIIVREKYLERSHVSYSGRSVLEVYLVVAAITFAVVVGISLFSEPDVEVIDGSRFFAGAPTIDQGTTANASQRGGRLEPTFRFARLIPVPDHRESDTEPPSEAYSFLHDFKLPTYFCRVFSERDLLGRLETGTVYYSIYGQRSVAFMLWEDSVAVDSDKVSE